MPSHLEFHGKNVDQAVETACAALKLGKEELRYRILSHGSTGIFGLVGAKRALIRVENPEAGGGSSASAAGGGKPTPPVDVPERQTSEDTQGGERPEAATDENDPETVGREVLERLLAEISPGADITTGRKNGRILFHVRGENAALLIGKQGHTLAAIQYLLDKIVNRRFEARVKLLVDVEGYLQNKKENLRQLAYKLAEKAKKSGKPASVGQMNAHDRRIVHIALKEDRLVRTQSVGDGAMRKLLILPKKSGPNRKGAQRAR